ncbi:MAG TPA: hypothetical protein VMI06_01180 [Terriglobia bacterium]|nr:hypothetical protein [Terriglobia bacterium]
MLFLASLGFILSAALGLRGVLTGWWRAYKVVFVYFTLTAIHSVVAWMIYRLRPGIYPAYYWIMEAVFVVFGFGLVWQVYAAIPQPFPGVGQIIKTLAQRIAAIAPLLLIAAVLLSPRGTVTIDILERNVRAFQAVLILIVFGLARYYEIPLSRNLSALIQGFGLYSAIFIARFTLVPLQFAGFWQYVMPLGYCCVQMIWLAGLWNYEQAPALCAEAAPVEVDTYSQMLQLQQQLQRPFRP